MNNLLKTSICNVLFNQCCGYHSHKNTKRSRVDNYCTIETYIEMNTAKLNVHKKVLQEVCEKFIGAKEFIKDKIEEICCNEKLSVEDVN